MVRTADPQQKTKKLPRSLNLCRHPTDRQLLKNCVWRTTTNSKQAKFLAQSCSNVAVDISQNLRLLANRYCVKMNRSTIKWYIGELLVKQKLENERIGVTEHYGNQSGYDMEIPGMNVKVDVKLSLYKSEIKNHEDFKSWGWALKFERTSGEL